VLLAASSPRVLTPPALKGGGPGVLLAAYQKVPPVPGREAGEVAPAPHQESGNAPPPTSGLGGGLFPLLIMIVPMLLLLFFMSRSQQEKQAAAIAGLKKGDRVLTQSGLVGRLVEMTDRYAKVEIAPGVKVEILKTGILGADTPEAQASVAKK
jgi:preprotein translocase subunit YajC